MGLWIRSRFVSCVLNSEIEQWELMVVLSFQVVQLSPPPRRLSLRSPKAAASGLIRIRCGIAEPSGEPAPLGQKTRYNDSIFEKAFMTLFARKMERFADPAAGKAKEKKGWMDWGYDYESFVDVSKRVMQRRNRMQQQQVVREVLLSMLPPGAPAQVDIILTIHLFIYFFFYSSYFRVLFGVEVERDGAE